MKIDLYKSGPCLAFLSIIGLSVVGCGGPADLGTPPDRLGDAQYALYFSAPSPDIDGADGRGRVVLVDADGSVAVLPTAGMDNAQLVWTEEGLFFSDLQNDYRLDEAKLTVIESAKTDSQYAMHAMSSSSAVGIYNLGFSEDGGYTSQIVTTSGDASILAEVEGGYYITTNCDGIIYGVGIATGPYSVTSDPDTEPVILNQLTGTTDGHELNIGQSTQARDNAMTAEAPCIDGKIYYVSDSIGGGLEAQVQPVVSMWDIATGEYQEILIEAEGLEEPLIRSDGIGAPQVTTESIREGALQWFGVGNRIMSTNLENGQTQKAFEVDGVTDEILSSRALFIKDEVVVMVDSDGSDPYELVRYDRDTGEELRFNV